MKKLFLTIVSTLMLVTMVACAPKEKDVDFDVEKVMDQIVEETWGEGMSFPFELSQYVDSYELDPEIISEFAGYGGSMLDANRMMIWEVKDVKDIETVKEIALKEQENLINVFKQYLPAPLVVAEASQVVVKGRYVFFVSHENLEDALAIFNSQFNK